MNITINQIQVFLVNCASMIAAGGVICAFALKIGKEILNKQLDPFNVKIKSMEEARIKQHEETKSEIAILKEELNKNSLNTMKNTICNETIPLSERVSVGKEYIDKGGNGAVKIFVHKLEEDYEKQLKKGEK